MHRRIMRAILFAAIFLLLGHASATANPMKVFSPGDPVFEDLRFLSREAGTSLLSLTPPMSNLELESALSRIDPDILSASGRATYDRLRAALTKSPKFKDGLLGISVTPKVTVESRARSNEDINWSRDESDSESFISLPTELFFAETAYATMDLDLRLDPSAYDGDGYFAMNIPFAAADIDMALPHRAFVAAGGDWWTFQIGRDKLSFGLGVTGNMAISDTPDYYDFARISLFSPNLKYSLLVSQIPLSIEDLCAKGYEAEANALTSTTQRYLYYHRLDARFFGRFSLSIGEGLMVGNSPIELRFLNPLTVFHGFFSWLDYSEWETSSGNEGDMVGSLFNVDFDWAIAPSLALYGQFVMNQFATSYELENWPEDGSPNGLGWLGGVEYAREFGPIASRFDFEAVYADPYLYVLSSPFASFLWMRRDSLLSGNSSYRYTWIGHPDGRDFILFSARANFSKAPYGLTLGTSYKLQGEHGIAWDWSKGEESFSQTTPTGTAERTLTMSATVSWQPFLNLACSLYVAGIRVDDADHIEGATRLGAETAIVVAYTF